MIAMNIFPYIAFILFAFHFHSSQAYTDCGSITGVLEKLEMIPPCDTVCNLPSGQNVTIKLSFKSKINTKTAKAVIHGEIGGVPFPFPLPNPDACQDSGITCPLQENTEYVYHKELPILSEYPKLYVVIKYELQDENGQDLLCIKIPSRIT